MAGDWIKMDCTTPEKAEVLALTVKLGWDDPDLTVGKLFRLWRWFDQHTTDGNARGVSLALLDRVIGVSGFCAAVSEVGWLVVEEAGIRLPKFDSHNGATAKQRAQTAKRVAKHAANAKPNAGANAASVSSALPREREEKRESANALSAREPSKAGAVGMALKAAGIDPQSINLSDPVLLALIEQGATPEEFGGLAAEAVRAGKRNPIKWVLAVLPERRKDAAATALAPAVTTVQGETVEQYQQRIAAEKRAERERLAAQKGPSAEVAARLSTLVGGMRAA